MWAAAPADNNCLQVAANLSPRIRPQRSPDNRANQPNAQTAMNDTTPRPSDAPPEARAEPRWRRRRRLWAVLAGAAVMIAGVGTWAPLRTPADAPAPKGRGDPNPRPPPLVAPPAR